MRVDARRIYEESARRFQQRPIQLPLSEAEFRRSLTPENMVQSARGLGGPQSSEVTRMLAGERTRLANDRTWVSARRAGLAQAEQQRHAAFEALKTRR